MHDLTWPCTIGLSCADMCAAAASVRSRLSGQRKVDEWPPSELCGTRCQGKIKRACGAPRCGRFSEFSRRSVVATKMKKIILFVLLLCDWNVEASCARSSPCFAARCHNQLAGQSKLFLEREAVGATQLVVRARRRLSLPSFLKCVGRFKSRYTWRFCSVLTWSRRATLPRNSG